MKRNNLLQIMLLVAAASAGLWASRESSESIARSLLEPLLESANDSPEESSNVLVILQGLAEDGSASLTEERRLRIMGEADIPVILWDLLPVRAEAYRAIGQLGTPEAISYLEGVSEEDFAGTDEVHALWSAAQEALYGARLDRLSALGDKALFLEQTIRDYQNVIGNGYLANWAAEELCNRGALSSYVVVEHLFYDRDSKGGPSNARFCELRMRAVASNPDRAAAIGSVLRVTSRPPDSRLMRWAISQLASMKSERASQEMKRFQQEVMALPDASPQKRELMPYAALAREHQEKAARRARVANR